MKNKIKKWGYSNKNGVIIFIIGLVFSYIVLTLLGYLHQIYILDNSNTIFSKDAIYFRVDQTTNTEPIDFSFLQSFSGIDSVNIFKENDDFQVPCECLIMNYYPLPSQGRGFDEYDFINNRHAAYVGCKASEVFDLTNLVIRNTSYKIIGEYLSEIPSLNYAVFYSDGTLDKVAANDAFIIDGKNSRTINATYDFMNQNLMSNGIEVYSFDPNASHISDFISYRGKVIVAVSLVLLLLMFSNIATAMFWILSNGDFIRISTLLGTPGVKSYLLRKLLYILLASSLIGYGLMITLKTMLLPLFIIAIAITVILLSTVCSFLLAKKIIISETT